MHRQAGSHYTEFVPSAFRPLTHSVETMPWRPALRQPTGQAAAGWVSQELYKGVGRETGLPDDREERSAFKIFAVKRECHPSGGLVRMFQNVVTSGNVVDEESGPAQDTKNLARLKGKADAGSCRFEDDSDLFLERIQSQLPVLGNGEAVLT